MFSKNKTAEKCVVALAEVQYYLKTKGMIFSEYYSLIRWLEDGMVRLCFGGGNEIFPEKTMPRNAVEGFGTSVALNSIVDMSFYSIELYDNIVYDNRVKREFIYTEPFRKCWKAMGLGDDEQHYLENILLENPRKVAVIEGLGGVRKLRIKLECRGKSGGGRVIYLDVLEKEKLYLLFAYPKNVQEDLTPEQRKLLRRMVEAIMEE